MEILEMIEEWSRGCSCAGPTFDQLKGHPIGTSHTAECRECTIALIKAIESRAKPSAFTGRITPNFYR